MAVGLKLVKMAIVLQTIITTDCGSIKVDDKMQTFVPENHVNWVNLDHGGCGQSLSTRIVGGSEASLAEFPWIVLIGVRDVLNTKSSDKYLSTEDLVPSEHFTCGGTILNRYYILTAAHCITKLQPKLSMFVRGGAGCTKDKCKHPRQDVGIARSYSHPGYKTNGGVTSHDIAVIELETPFTLNEFVLPCCLPGSEAISIPPWGKVGIVAGWGVEDLEQLFFSRPITARALQKLSVIITDSDHCDIPYNSTNQLCAVGGNGRSSCRGDSGGPLTLKSDLSPRHYLIGIISHGPSVCGAANGSMIFTKISYYVQFILDKIVKK